MGLTETKEGYRFTESENGSNGERAFISGTDGSETLPSIGDPFDVANPTVLATEINKEVYGYAEGEPCGNSYIYTVSYEEQFEESWYTPLGKADDEQRSFTAGGEIISVNNKPNEAGIYYWTTTPTASTSTTTGRCVQKIYRANPVGTFSRTVQVAESSFTGYFTGSIRPILGHINAAAWESGGYGLFPKGTCLFNSANGNLTRAKNGNLVWAITLNFSYKFIPELGDSAEDTWQYIWRSDTSGDLSEGAWQVPIKKISGAPTFEGMMYESTSFSPLYSGIL